MSEVKLSSLILPNYWDLLELGMASSLTRSRKMFLRGGRFSGKSYFAAHHIVLSLLELELGINMFFDQPTQK
jgi:hypothetical protein